MANSTKVSACGLLFCFNEMDVIEETIKYYLSQNIDLVVFDNQSTDSSMTIVNSFFCEKNQYEGKIKDVVHIATEGYEWEHILREANDYMHKNLTHYEWILIIDADTHYASPVKGLSLLEYLHEVDKLGYNIIQGRYLTFYPTEKDDSSITNYSERIKHYQLNIVFPQEKIFRYHPSISFYSFGAHTCLRDDRRVCINPGFILKHYIWISYEQGVKKIFEDRKPRYPKDFPIQVQYSNMLTLEKDFIKDSGTLKYYNEKKELITRRRFLLVAKYSLLYGSIFSFFKREIKNSVKNTVASSLQSSANPAQVVIGPGQIIARWFKKITRTTVSASNKEFIKYVIRLLRPYSVNPSLAYYHDNYDGYNLIDKWITPPLGNAKALVSLPLHSYPLVYHFLMTSFCNAKCIFCNQFDDKPAKEITLGEFKIMISHVNVNSAREFYFSGGGEPLLCKDLFDIIRFVNTNFPKIKIKIITNGLLIEKYAENIAKLDIDQLIISVHGTEDMNNYILQSKNSGNIFSGISALNKYQELCNKKINKYFFIAVSSININEVPKLIKKAADLNVNGVLVEFCRYYSRRISGKLRIEDSLFFHKELYNSVIKKAARLAKTLGVYFSSAPSFLKKFSKERCCAPWYLVLVDWKGDIYPCTGGEVHFYEKVKSGEYYFGNLLKEDVRTFWLNESYVKLRRHLVTSYKEKNVPECDACHNIICFEGPDLARSHLMS